LRHDRRYAALGIIGVAFSALFLRDYGDRAKRRDFEGKRQPGHPAADHDKIKVPLSHSTKSAP
jgi:hypothetical protein